MRIGVIEQNVTPQAQVIREKALTRLLVEKGMFTRKEFLEMVRVVNQEIKDKEDNLNEIIIGQFGGYSYRTFSFWLCGSLGNWFR